MEPLLPDISIDNIMDTDIFDRVVEVNLNNESDGPTSNEPSQTLLHDTEAVIQSWTQDSQSRNDDPVNQRQVSNQAKLHQIWTTIRFPVILLCLPFVSPMRDVYLCAKYIHGFLLEDRQRGHIKLVDEGKASLSRYKSGGSLEEIDRAIRSFEDALPTLKSFEENRWADEAAILFLLAYCYKLKYSDHGGLTTDGHRGITTFQAALQLLPPGHAIHELAQSRRLFAIYFKLQYEAERDPMDLEGAVRFHWDGLLLFPSGHPDRLSVIVGLADCLRSRFDLEAQSQDIDAAIQCYQCAMTLCSQGDPNRLMAQINLASCLRSRYEFRGDIHDLEEAIRLHRGALQIHQDGHTIRLPSLNNLANCLRAKFKREGDVRDLEEAIQCHKSVLLLYPPDHPNRSLSLNNLANCLETRYNLLGDEQDLHEAIEYHRDALSVHVPGHPQRPTSLNGLATCLHLRFKERGMIEDLKEATQCDRDVLLLRPPGHPERPTSLSNLAHSLLRAYGDLGDPSNLEEAVQHSREALKLCSQDHPSRATLLHVLANCLSLIYDKSGNIQHLDEAIQCHKDELIWYPPGHRSRPNSLNDLGSCLFTRFEQQGHSQDLEEAIQHFRTGLSLCLPGNPGRAGLLSNLGACLESQYQYYCDINDLEDATKLYREVLLLHPPGHPGRPMSLNNLGTCIRAQFLRNSVEDVEEAIQCFRESLLLCPSEHPQRSLPVHNLSTCLWLRYKKSNRVEDLEEANQLNRDALKLRPLGHSKRMLSLTNLAGSLVALYEHREDIHYIEEAIQCLHEAIQMSLPNHPALTLQWSALASIHAQYHQILGPVSEPNESTRLFKKAVNHETAILKDRFNASLSWISVEKGPTLMDAYTISLELADQYVLVRSSIASRHQILLEVPATLATNAAATAISSGNLPRAVEFLEQGRSLLWSQISRSRTSLHRLEKVNPGLADEFAELSKQLEASAAPNTVDTRPLYSIDDEAQKYRRITVAWHDVVDRIRQLDGFSSFLRPAAFLNLKDAAQQGPIIIINIGNHRCDAIILDTFGQLHLLPLPDIEIMAIIDLYVRFHTVIQRDKPRKGLIEILRCLWDDIVEPIVKKLQELGIQPGSHIWWCPTLHLTMLPLHAAGPHRPGKPNLPDLYVSSYTPTLSGLCKSLQAEVQDQSSSATSYIPRLLVVAQPAVQGQTEIPHVREELQKIIEVASPVDILQDGNATRESVLSSLQTHPWIHFGCHGSQIIDEPFQSCFFVSGQRLTLVDLIQAHLPDAQYALLAACHSAAGDWRRPDEAIHLAAALQFSGFRSVIGTMYAMADIDGPALAEAVYKHMYRRQDEHDGISEVVVDFRETAKALNIATRALRDSGVPLERWINFIHIGA